VTPERRDAIVRLLRTRDEHLPEPVHRTEASAGFVHQDPDHRETCPDCLANDRPMFGCETCGGSGWVSAPRVRDPYATEAVVPFGFDGSKHDASHARDREIEVLGQQLRPASAVDELADANAHPYGWERARRQMLRLYDYPALDLALERLRLSDDGASRALHAVYVYAWQVEPLLGPLHRALERGLAFLDEHLPDRLRVPNDEKRSETVRGPLRPEAGIAAKTLRDTEMRRGAAAGATVMELCERFGVSKSTVYAVVNGTHSAAV
jgi:hypothetical protein